MSAAEAQTRVVLITGAAGGLGQGLVAEFAAQGWRIAAAYHRSTVHRQSEQIWPVQLDVTRHEQVQTAAKQLVARWGRIDALINNAGVIAFLATTQNISGQLFQLDSRISPWT